jgi:methylated-DNA-protein-cysteine methyltransferase-like protein
MTERGDEVAWWRVLRSDGTCAPEVRAQQTRRLRAEGVVMRGDARVDMTVARYTPEE